MTVTNVPGKKDAITRAAHTGWQATVAFSIARILHDHGVDGLLGLTETQLVGGLTVIIGGLVAYIKGLIVNGRHPA